MPRAVNRCRHCGWRKANATRGLCRACSDTPGLRDMYPGENDKYGRELPPDIDGPVPPPASPTDARPGTPAKVAELERRATAGVELWHPQDPGTADDFRPLLLVPGRAG